MITSIDFKSIVYKAIDELPVRANESCSVYEENTRIDKLGLDSLDGIEFTLIVEEKLQIELDTDVNLFVDEENCEYRTVKEIIDIIRQIVEK